VILTFDIVVADPSWAFDDKLSMSSVKRGAEANYPTMTVAEIVSLRVPVSDDALLALWVPSALLFTHALPVIKAWGFEYKGLWVWGKCTKGLDGLAFGMGHTFRQAHEVACICTRGSITKHIEDRAQRSFFVEMGEVSPNARHSQKPEKLQDSLDLMWPSANKLELYARREREGWLCIGNELTGNDIRIDLENLA